MDDGWKKPLFLLNWMEKYNKNVMTKLDAIQNMFGTAGEADVSPSDIKGGKKAYNGTTLITGTMPSNTAEQKLISCGQSYLIPEGYHDGTGSVSADTLANQTEGTAAAGDVLIDKTAYVNGNKVTGTMPEQGAKSKKLTCGESYTIPAGHHNGQGKVTAETLESQTSATAVATKLLSGLTAWVNGKKITGTMANKAGTTVKASAISQDEDNIYFTIPASGFYDTSSKIYTENSNLGSNIKYVTSNSSTLVIGAGTTTAEFTIPATGHKKYLIYVSQTRNAYNMTFTVTSGGNNVKSITFLNKSTNQVAAIIEVTNSSSDFSINGTAYNGDDSSSGAQITYVVFAI